MISSMEPLPPATPPAQKPTRIIKPRPPTRPRPYLPPRPDSARLNRGPTPPLPPEGPAAETQGDGCPRATDPPCSSQQELHHLQNSGTVRKIVVRFDHAKGPEKGEADKPIWPPPSCSQPPSPVVENGAEKVVEEEKEAPGQAGKWSPSAEPQIWKGAGRCLVQTLVRDTNCDRVPGRGTSRLCGESFQLNAVGLTPE